MKKLTKQDVEYWTNKVENTYTSYRGRVRDSVPPVNYNSINKKIKAIIEPLMIERVKKCIRECDDIHTGVWIDSLSPNETLRLIPDELKEEIDRLDIEHCHKIRELCNDAHTKRDYYIRILHSQPDVEILDEIYDWCVELDKQYPTKVCQL